MRVAVVGCGVFGLAAALELRARGHAVTAFDQAAVPAAKAASNDTSKTIQRLYGERVFYADLAERADAGWRAWQARTGERFYADVGHVFVARGFEPGTRGYESYRALAARSDLIRLFTLAEARERFPQLALGPDETVFYDAWGGYLESGRAIAALARLARAEGVELRERVKVRAIEEAAGEARVVVEGGAVAFDRVVLATGAWIGRFVPEIAARVRITRQCMAFFAPDDPASHAPGPPFRPSGGLPVFAVDAPPDNWYGHPLADGRVKLADNPLGPPADPDDHRDGDPAFEARARAFVERWMPGLARGRLLGSRSCLYDVTPDADFVVDWAPGSSRLLVAGGGSGHGFKFGGSLGPIVADAAEEKANALGARFRIGSRFA